LGYKEKQGFFFVLNHRKNGSIINENGDNEGHVKKSKNLVTLSMRQPVEIQVENVYPGRPLNMLR
jgi:hypothetical protein